MSEDNHAEEGQPEQTPEQEEVTIQEEGSRWRELYRTDDYWAIWLGLAIIAAGLIIFLPHPPENMDKPSRHPPRP